MSQKIVFKLSSWCFSMVLLALLSLGQISQVEASAVYSFDSANFYGTGYYLPQTIGNVFTVTKNITVTSLGDTIAESFSSNADVIGYASTGKLSVDPDINFLPFAARYSIGMTGLEFPTGTSLASAEFYVGPNFDPISDPIPDNSNSGVPIPGAIWLLGSGLLGLTGWRRFKKT
jgi:hypothetical protein